MRYLAVDLGDKKVGIALETEGISIPRDIIARTKLVSYLKKIVREEDITHIIVGLPYDLYGIQTKQLEKTEKFIEKLTQILPLQKIIGYDERFTTLEAKRDEKRHTPIDDVSASLILDSYLYEHKIHTK